MKKWPRIVLMVIGVLVVVVFGSLMFITRSQAIDTVTHPLDERPKLIEDPADYGLEFEEVTVTNEDGLRLFGWFVPGTNGATIIAQHGTPGGRQNSLHEAEFLNRHGYSVLMGSFRAHDESEGDLISFGYHEVKDMAAWHQYLLTRDDVDPDRIGIFGESMGGGTGILYTAQNQDIKAIATASAFALTQATVESFIKHELAPPNWITSILAKLILFWGEREANFDAEGINTEAVIGQISPRPVFIMQGGEDKKISPDSGQRLFDAAGEPKEFWFAPSVGHVDFEDYEPEAYEQRVVAFFDQHLLGE